jgi:hypothetical protein
MTTTIRACWKDFDEYLCCSSDQLMVAMACNYLNDNNREMTVKLMDAVFGTDNEVIEKWMTEKFVLAKNEKLERSFPFFISAVKNGKEEAMHLAWLITRLDIIPSDLSDVFERVRRGDIVITYSDTSKKHISIY